MILLSNLLSLPSKKRLKPLLALLETHLGAEGGTRPFPSADVHQRAPSALSPVLSSTNVHHYPLLSAGYGVRKGVSQECSSSSPGCWLPTWKLIQSAVMVGRIFSALYTEASELRRRLGLEAVSGVCLWKATI
jgi:hypothetical protein